MEKNKANSESRLLGSVDSFLGSYLYSRLLIASKISRFLVGALFVSVSLWSTLYASQFYTVLSHTAPSQIDPSQLMVTLSYYPMFYRDASRPGTPQTYIAHADSSRPGTPYRADGSRPGTPQAYIAHADSSRPGTPYRADGSRPGTPQTYIAHADTSRPGIPQMYIPHANAYRSAVPQAHRVHIEASQVAQAAQAAFLWASTPVQVAPNYSLFYERELLRILSLAAFQGRADDVENIIARNPGLDLNSDNFHLTRPLMSAIKARAVRSGVKIRILKALMDAGADADKQFNKNIDNVLAKHADPLIVDFFETRFKAAEQTAACALDNLEEFPTLADSKNSSLNSATAGPFFEQEIDARVYDLIQRIETQGLGTSPVPLAPYITIQG